jgi:PAS domain S-box-containing protein
MTTLATRFQALTFATRLSAVMIALIWLTAAVSYFGTAAALAAALLVTAFVAMVAGEIARPPAPLARGAGAPGHDHTVQHHAIQDRDRESAHEQRGGTEKSYRAAMDSIAQSVVTYALDGTITAWNPGAERLYGFSADEAIGRNATIIIPEDRRREIGEAVARLRRNEAVGDIETKRLRKDRSLIDVRLHIFPIRDDGGNLIGTGSIARDVSGQKLVEEMFRLAVEACPSGMLMTDRSGAIVLLNTEIERLFGYSRDELIGQSVEVLVPTGLRSQHIRHRAAYVLKPETRRMGAGRDLFGRRKDGTEFPVEVGLNPVNTRDGVLVLSVIADISERKRIERLKDDFVSTVSHELRTPLTSISGSLGLLVGNAAGKLPDAVMRLLTIAHKNSQRLVRLINDILDIEKMESGEVVFNMKQVDVRGLVEQAIEASHAYAEGLGVTIRIDPSSTSAVVRADPDRLVQVVTNLLSNAIKYSPAGGEIVVSIAAAAQEIAIAVRDHGPGIPVEFRSRIFEKFAQADATDSRQKGGTGLGLSIAKRIVTRLGGQIGFADAPGGGTVFRVKLPAWPGHDDARADNASSDDAEAETPEHEAMGRPASRSHLIEAVNGA